MKKEKNTEILSPGARVVRWVLSIILMIYTGITIFALSITVMDSLKSKGDIVTNFVGFPKQLTMESYFRVLKEANLLLYLKNSVVLTVGGTLGCILLAGLTAYGISRFDFKGKNFLSGYFLMGMMVPVQSVYCLCF